MTMTEMERHVVASVKERFGTILDLEAEPGVILEILRRYRNDLDRTEAAPDEYVQVRTGAVGGVGQASRSVAPKRESAGDDTQEAVAGEITNTELMRELLRIRKDLNSLAGRFST